MAWHGAPISPKRSLLDRLLRHRKGQLNSGPFGAFSATGLQTLQPDGKRLAVVLLFSPQGKEEFSALSVADQQRKPHGIAVELNQVVFQNRVEAEKADQISGMLHRPQLGGSRCHPQSQHALH